MPGNADRVLGRRRFSQANHRLIHHFCYAEVLILSILKIILKKHVEINAYVLISVDMSSVLKWPSFQFTYSGLLQYLLLNFTPPPQDLEQVENCVSHADQPPLMEPGDPGPMGMHRP